MELLWFSKARVRQLLPTLCPSPTSSGIKDNEHSEQSITGLDDLELWDHFSAGRTPHRGSDVRGSHRTRSPSGCRASACLIRPPSAPQWGPSGCHFFSTEILPDTNIFMGTVRTRMGSYSFSSFISKCRRRRTRLTSMICVPSPQPEGKVGASFPFVHYLPESVD